MKTKPIISFSFFLMTAVILWSNPKEERLGTYIAQEKYDDLLYVIKFEENGMGSIEEINYHDEELGSRKGAIQWKEKNETIEIRELLYSNLPVLKREFELIKLADEKLEFKVRDDHQLTFKKNQCQPGGRGNER